MKSFKEFLHILTEGREENIKLSLEWLFSRSIVDVILDGSQYKIIFNEKFNPTEYLVGSHNFTKNSYKGKTFDNDVKNSKYGNFSTGGGITNIVFWNAKDAQISNLQKAAKIKPLGKPITEDEAINLITKAILSAESAPKPFKKSVSVGSSAKESLLSEYFEKLFKHDGNNNPVYDSKVRENFINKLNASLGNKYEIPVTRNFLNLTSYNIDIKNIESLRVTRLGWTISNSTGLYLMSAKRVA